MATTKLEKLTLKRGQLNAQIQAIKSKEASQKRKVLIGGVVMKMLKTGEMPQERLTQFLDKHLEKNADRVFFELPERIKNEVKRETLEQELIGT